MMELSKQKSNNPQKPSLKGSQRPKLGQLDNNLTNVIFEL